MLLKLLTPEAAREDFLGDLVERHGALARRRGSTGADRWFWLQALSALVRFPLARLASRTARPGVGGRLPQRTPRRNLVDTMVKDIRYALRGLTRNVGFAAVVLATMAVAIGANTAVFSIVRGVLLKPLPLPDSEQLVLIMESNPGRGFSVFTVTPSAFLDWRERATTFSSMGYYTDDTWAVTDDRDAPEAASGVAFSSDMFATLGARPLLGRLFAADDFVSGSETKVILSESFWRRRYGADPAILGTTINLDGETHEVVGVLPDDFTLPNSGVDFWLPSPTPATWAEVRGAHFLRVYGRLKPGVTAEDAERDINRIEALRIQEFTWLDGWSAVVTPLHESIVRSARQPILILFGAVVLVMLIACANVASLLIARGTDRQHEISVRLALGASNRAIVRQFFVESLTLAALGGVLGAGLSYWFRGFILGLTRGNLPLPDAVTIDLPVLGFAVLLVVAAALFFGLVPLLAFKGHNAASLRGQLHGATQTATRTIARNSLVVAEIALAVVLAAGAGLLLQSIARLVRTDLGFSPETTMSFDVDLPPSRYPEADDVAPFYGEFTERLAGLPNVMSVGAINIPPLARRSYFRAISFMGMELPPGSGASAQIRGISEDYFATMRIPVIEGRGIEATDVDGSELVAVVNRTLVSRFLNDREVVGTTLSIDGSEPYRIVGVIDDVLYWGPREEVDAELYTSIHQSTWRRLSFVVRALGDPLDLLNSIRSQLGEMDSQLPLMSPQTFDSMIADITSSERMATGMLSLLAVVAVGMAMIGIYGLMTYAVSRRTREIGLRMAIGAGTGAIARMIFGNAGMLVVGGLAVGLAGTALVSRFLTSLLYGVTPLDPVAYVGACLAVTAVMTLATLIPALRAARVDPVVALKSE